MVAPGGRAGGTGPARRGGCARCAREATRLVVAAGHHVGGRRRQAPAYVGNGYVGTRVPASGAGYVETPIAAETHVAGVYADVPDPITGESSTRVGEPPGWTQLDVVVSGKRLDAAGGSGYRQVLDLRRGTMVTTTSTVASAGRRTHLQYDVLLDRGHARTGLVSVAVRPRWSGRLQVRDVLGAGADLTPGALSKVRATATRSLTRLAVRAKGTGTVVAEAARLHGPAGHGCRPRRPGCRCAGPPRSTSRRAHLPLHQGRRVRDVGRRPAPEGAAAHASTRSPRTVRRSNAVAWAAEWRHDVVVPGQPELQRRIHAAMFYLLASARPDVDASISPVGLSAGGYNDHVFWDAETWMYPALLALHPDDASTVVDYRFRTRHGAERNAESTGYDGMRFAWESARSGDEVTPTWAETGRLEQHVTADVALAQWQYYLATGDQDWLRARGWPVLRGAAEFWASRAEPDGDRFHITDVEGPDEENWPVDDEVYTNATAATTLRLATRAAQVLGETAPGSGPRSPDGLVVQPPQPLGGFDQVRPEFRGYAEQQVKQADAVLLTYPLGVPAARRGRPRRPGLLRVALRPGRPGDDRLRQQHRGRPARAGMCRLDLHPTQRRPVREGAVRAVHRGAQRTGRLHVPDRRGRVPPGVPLRLPRPAVARRRARARPDPATGSRGACS